MRQNGICARARRSSNGNAAARAAGISGLEDEPSKDSSREIAVAQVAAAQVRKKYVERRYRPGDHKRWMVFLVYMAGELHAGSFSSDEGRAISKARRT